MQDKVLKYFDEYLGGELNESTTDEQLDKAAMDLIFLTEIVCEFVGLDEKWGLGLLRRAINAPTRAIASGGRAIDKSLSAPRKRLGSPSQQIQHHAAAKTVLKNIDPMQHVNTPKTPESGAKLPAGSASAVNIKRYHRAKQNREALSKTERGRKLVADITPEKVSSLGDMASKALKRDPSSAFHKTNDAGIVKHADIGKARGKKVLRIASEPEGHDIIRNKLLKPRISEVNKYYDHDKEEEEKRVAPGLEFKAVEKALVPVVSYKKQLEKLKRKHKGKVVQPSLTVGSKGFGSKEPTPIRKGDVAKHTLSSTEKENERKLAKGLAHEKLYGDSPRKEREQQGQMKLFHKS